MVERHVKVPESILPCIEPHVTEADQSRMASSACRAPGGPQLWANVTFAIMPPTPSNLDDRPGVEPLFANLKAKLPVLEELLKESHDRRWREDRVYRFYHQSFKVFDLQAVTQDIVNQLQELAPDVSLNAWFNEIIAEGTGKTFGPGDNENWTIVTRPILEAFFHARYFLEVAVKYGKELEYPPCCMPSGWAALLYLYNLR